MLSRGGQWPATISLQKHASDVIMSYITQDSVHAQVQQFQLFPNKN